MQVEIDKTVNHDPGRAYEGGKGYCPIPMILPVPESRESLPVNSDQKPDHQREANDASLNQQLYIVVVSFINKQIRLKTPVLRVHSRKRIQAPTPNWFLRKHGYAVSHDLRADARTQVSNSR